MRSSCFATSFLVGLAGVGACCAVGRADTRVVPSGDWSTPSEWSGGFVPTAAQNADVNGGRSVDITGAGGPFAANDVNVGNSGTGVVNHSGNTLNQTYWAFIGRGGNAGTYNLSGTGSFSSTNLGDANGARIYVGVDGGSNGFYNQTGGTTSQRLVYIGDGGRGTVNLSGGSFTTSTDLYFGNNSGTGILEHSGGTLTAGNTWAAIGGTSKSTLTFSGGTATLGQLRLGNSSAGAEGTMVVSGGNVTSSYHEGGWSAVSRAQVSAGTYTNNGTMTLGPVSGNGTFTVAGGVVNQNGQIRLGSAHGQGGNTVANGTLIVSSGTLNAGGSELNVGFRNGGAGSARGTYTVSGGVAAVGTTYVGRDTGATGTVNISGGLATFGNTSFGEGGGGAGTGNISGGNVQFGYLNVGNGAGSPGTMNHSGGAITVTSWLGIATSAGGVGTWNATGGILNSTNMEVAPTAGSSAILNVSAAADLRVGSLLFSHHAPGASSLSRMNLEGGTLRADTISILNHNGNEFNWGSGAIALNTAVGNIGGADLSLGTANSPFVGVGRTLAFNKQGSSGVYGGSVTVATGSGINATGSDIANASTLDLGPLYLSAGVRFNSVRFDQGVNLDLSDTDDTLRLGGNNYYLRPFGFFTEDYGSLPLIEFTGGGTMTGTFDTFIGIADDGKGFSQFTGAFTGAAFLPLNTWYLQQTAAGITFHYKVAGIVPEPGTFGMLAAGAFGLRAMRRLRQLRDRVSAA